uniref:At2g24240-like C-terminal beta-propeller domain-containing protein n=1 Tax=Oryza sativa subsp. japonica TaxID=39947 RepID=Q6ZAX8_ORYSJ|nr:hypothetical protein [Oryza sativa Japonica Group]
MGEGAAAAASGGGGRRRAAGGGGGRSHAAGGGRSTVAARGGGRRHRRRCSLPQPLGGRGAATAATTRAVAPSLGGRAPPPPSLRGEGVGEAPPLPPLLGRRRRRSGGAGRGEAPPPPLRGGARGAAAARGRESGNNAKVLPGGARRSTSLYYGLLDRFREARWGPFDGDQLQLAASMAGNAAGDGTAVRAAPDGGCCVAHGSASAIGGIGVWDCTTGEQADFFYEPPGCALGDADKLQWLDGTSTLMAATMFPRTDTSFIILLDFRDKKNVAWSWSDVGTPASLEDKNVLHAIAMEDGRAAAPCSAAGRLTQVCHHACSREERKKRKRKDVGPTPPRRRLAMAEPSRLGPAAVAHSHLCSAARKKKGKKDRERGRTVSRGILVLT